MVLETSKNEITLKFLENHKRNPYLAIKIKGETFRFLIDTGAFKTCLSPRVVQNLEISDEVLKRILNKPAQGVGGLTTTFVVPIEFRFCGVSISHVSILYNLSLDLHDPNACHALVGQDILQKFRSYTVDNLTHTITFRR